MGAVTPYPATYVSAYLLTVAVGQSLTKGSAFLLYSSEVSPSSLIT